MTWTLSFALVIRYSMREEQSIVLEKHIPRTLTFSPSSKTVTVSVKDSVTVVKVVVVIVFGRTSVIVCEIVFVVV